MVITQLYSATLVSATFQLPPRFARWALCAPPGAPALPRAPLRRSQRARKPVRSPRAARRRRGARSVVCGRADSCKTGVGVHFCTPQADERFIRQKRFESFQRKTLLLAFAYLQRFVIRVLKNLSQTWWYIYVPKPELAARSSR